MKYLKLSTIVILCFIFLRCENSTEPNESNTGDIEITVINQYGYPIEDAVVFIKNEEFKSQSDAYGKVFFENVKKGTYEIFAYKTALGSGKSIVEIEIGKLNKVEVDFIDGKLFEPSISFQKPYSFQKHALGDSIKFICLITDNYSNTESINVSLSSSINGFMAEGYPNKDGIFEYSTTSLSKGEHYIRLEAKDSDGYVGIDSVLVRNVMPPRVTLYEPNITELGVEIRWSECNDPDFERYEIYRSIDNNGSYYYDTKIGTITDKKEISIYDYEPPITDSIFYRVVSYNLQHEHTESEFVKVINPAGVLYNYTINDVVIHPNSNIIYFTTKREEIIAFNLNTKTEIGKIESSTELGYIDIGENGYGLELYVSNKSGYIDIYNSEDLEKIISINCLYPVTSCAIDGLGHIFAGLKPSYTYGMPVRSYSREDGNMIFGDGEIYEGRLKIIPNKNGMISIENNAIEYFKFDENGRITKNKKREPDGNENYYQRIFSISPNGEYFITSWNGTIYSAEEDMNYLGKLPGGNVQYIDFAFSDDGSTIYAASESSKLIHVYTYPNIKLEKTIKTKGYPAKLFKKQDKLFIISKDEETAFWSTYYRTLFETVEL